MSSTSALGSNSPQVTVFEVASPLSCSGATATASVRYSTLNTNTVAFLTDEGPANGSPPVSGSHDVSLPCDGNYHTIMIVAVGPSGQAVATKAIRTEPQG